MGLADAPPDPPRPATDAASPDPSRPATDGAEPVRITALRLAPGTRFGAYRIVRRLGYGGTSEVYLAEELALGRRVALKIFLARGELDRAFLDRFEREAKAAARILHPNVVTLFASGEQDGFLYMAFEYVAGGDLSIHLKRGEPLSEEAGLRLLRESVLGLQALDEAGLVHRDIKPHNIFLGDEGQAKLGDLGLARSTKGDDSLTVTGTVLGTPAFMSPEQALAKQALDIRSDIYSLGSTFFALLTGRLPFEGETPFAITHRIIGEQTPPRARTVRPDLSPRVERMLMRMMLPRPERRFQKPGELLEAIDARIASGTRSTILVPSPFAAASWTLERVAVLTTLALLGLVAVGLTWIWNAGTSAGELPPARSPVPTPDGSAVIASRDTAGEGTEAVRPPTGAGGGAPPSASAAAATSPDGAVAEPAPPGSAAAAATPPDGAGIWRIATGTDPLGRWLELGLGYATQRFRYVPPGEFTMGSPEEEAGRSHNERRHRVIISTGFWLADTECPQTLWLAVTGGQPATFPGGGRPVDSVSWQDCQDFCRRLNRGIPGLQARLPSEAEWEYACRAGGEGPFGRPCTASDLARFANIADANTSFDYRDRDLDDGVGDASAPVGGYRPNALGLYDMHGNLWEWCADGYTTTLVGDRLVDPVVSTGLTRVRRGGSWRDLPDACRSACRQGSSQDARRADIGFRLVLAEAPPAGTGVWQEE